MTAQLGLAFRRRDAGESSALGALPESVVQSLHDALRGFAGKPCVTADMLWDALSYATREAVATHPEAIGATFTYFAKHGWIERLSFTVRSQRANARGRRLSAWRVK